MKKRISLETLDLIFDAFEHAYYEGAGDGLWYTDHPYDGKIGCQLKPDAMVYHYWPKYLKEFPDDSTN